MSKNLLMGEVYFRIATRDFAQTVTNVDLVNVYENNFHSYYIISAIKGGGDIFFLKNH